jgi:hypothetical protein
MIWFTPYQAPAVRFDTPSWRRLIARGNTSSAVIDFPEAGTCRELAGKRQPVQEEDDEHFRPG